MAAYRLVRIAPASLTAEWRVPADGTLTLGRSHGDGSGPDVDLWPDRRVSRAHARIRQSQGVCWLEAISDRSSTRLEGARLERDRPTRLNPGAVIDLGRSRLLLLLDEWQIVEHRNWWIEIGLSPALSYALARHQPRTDWHIGASNCSSAATAGAQLEIILDPYARASVRIPPLAAGAHCQLPPPELHFDLSAFEALAERRWLTCRLRLNGEEIADTTTGLWILPGNEFSYAPQHRLTLAAFVLPNHPLTVRLGAEALAGLGVDASAEMLLGALFTHLRTAWRLDYRHEPPHGGAGAQRIRLPHDVLTDWNARSGQGTCLDLALLMAGALEASGMQPLVALVDLGSTYHALVGGWSRPGPRLDPILENRDYLMSDAVWIDPNGCTRDAEHCLSLDEARAKATEFLSSHRLLFALDVAAARQDGVGPLPFTGEPEWDPLAAEILAKAARCARQADQRLSTVQLLISLLRTDEGLLCRAFRHCVGDPDQAANQLAAARDTSAAESVASRNYRAILSGAKASAKVEGTPAVFERHLLVALFDIRSAALDGALESLGTGRVQLRAALEVLEPGVFGSPSDASYFRPPTPGR